MKFSATPSSWPALLLGLLVTIYWLRVLQMVMRTRLTAGRAANFVPPEPLGRLLRLVWIPVVVLWALVPIFTSLLVAPQQAAPILLRPIAGLYGGDRILGWTAVATALAAFGLTWVCWRRMGTSWRMGIDPNERTQLIFNGPYAYVRHPIYALSSLLMLATLATVPGIFMAVIALLHLALLQWEARREERYLLSLHGPAYANYIAQVGRFFPRSRRQ